MTIDMSINNKKALKQINQVIKKLKEVEFLMNRITIKTLLKAWLINKLERIVYKLKNPEVKND